jgi:hypothetical protein
MKGDMGTDLRGMKGLLLDYQSSIHHANFQYSRWVDVPQGVTGTVRTSRKSPTTLQQDGTKYPASPSRDTTVVFPTQRSGFSI